MIIPALNEEATVAAVVRAALLDAPFEVIVIDADSRDDTAAEAARAGATVLNWRDILPELAPVPGKGESLWRGVAAAAGEVVVFLDADLSDPAPGMVTDLASPFSDPTVHLVKADYARTLDGEPTGGGRVTELSAKPLIRLLHPQLADISQPLAGEYALRRESALALPFVAGYGVEAGLLVDVCEVFGRASIREVTLPPRRHRNRPLAELSPMAETVAAVLLQRAGHGDAGFPGQRPPLGDRI